jgi:hypothetical protein
VPSGLKNVVPGGPYAADQVGRDAGGHDFEWSVCRLPAGVLYYAAGLLMLRRPVEETLTIQSTGGDQRSSPAAGLVGSLICSQVEQVTTDVQ